MSGAAAPGCFVDVAGAPEDATAFVFGAFGFSDLVLDATAEFRIVAFACFQ